MGVSTLSWGCFPTSPTSCRVCGGCCPHTELAFGWHTLPGPCRPIPDARSWDLSPALQAGVAGLLLLAPSAPGLSMVPPQARGAGSTPPTVHVWSQPAPRSLP